MTIAEKDIIHLDYVGKVKESGEVFDATMEGAARDSGIYRPDQSYESMLVAVGDGWLIKGLEEALVGKEVGQEFEVEVPPEKGFGGRDPKKMVLYTRRKLLEAGIKDEIYPGMVVNVKGLPAVVRTSSGGRALLDFNPPLAGKTLQYKVWIKSRCETIDEKIRALIKRRYPKLAEKKKLYNLLMKGKVLKINISEKEMFDQDIQLVKKGMASDIFKYLPETEKVQFLEEIMKPPSPEEKEEAAEEGVEETKEEPESP